MASQPYTLRMDEALRQSLEAEAELEHRPAAQLATAAIQAMVDAKQAKRRAIAAALEEADASEFISSQAMNDWIDSWGADDEHPPPRPGLPIDQE